MFKVYGIKYEGKRDLPRAIRELMELTVYNKDGGVKYQLPGKQLASSIYSYDINDNDYYKSIMPVELAVSESKKAPPEKPKGAEAAKKEEAKKPEAPAKSKEPVSARRINTKESE